MTPTRVQRKRTKGWRMPENTVSVCRPGKFGNPFKVGCSYKVAEDSPLISINTNEEAVMFFRNWLYNNNEKSVHEIIRSKLKGKNLACFCPLDKPCHADVLLELANSEVKTETENL